MGRVCCELLESAKGLVRCKACSTQLARGEDLLSRSFHSKLGPCTLFASVANVLVGEPQDRLMTTGAHCVADIACVRCLTIVGWKYESAAEESQKYKEGKFILERMLTQEPGEPGLAPSRSSLLQAPCPPPPTQTTSPHMSRLINSGLIAATDWASADWQ